MNIIEPVYMAVNTVSKRLKAFYNYQSCLLFVLFYLKPFKKVCCRFQHSLCHIKDVVLKRIAHIVPDR